MLLVEITAAVLIKGVVSFLSVLSWLKVNTQEVCFGARGNSYGSFTMQHNGEITAFNLVYLRGNVSCRVVDINRYSYWGCKKGENLATFITNDSNAVIFPHYSDIKPYQLPGIRSDSKELVFNNLTVPLRVVAGQEFRVWYGEDLKNESEHDNGGMTCMNIYALYV